MSTLRLEQNGARPVWTIASLLLAVLGPVCGVMLFVLAFPDNHVESDGPQHGAGVLETIALLGKATMIWVGSAIFGLAAAGIGSAQKESSSNLRRFTAGLNGVVILLAIALWLSIFEW